MTLKDTLDEMARAIATKANEDATPLELRLSAFNALRAYYALDRKLSKGEREDDDGDETMDDLAAVIHGGKNGHARRAT